MFIPSSLHNRYNNLVADKKDVVKKRARTVSKAFRREETKKQLEITKQRSGSSSTVSDFVIAETSHKKLYHLKGLYFIVLVIILFLIFFSFFSFYS